MILPTLYKKTSTGAIQFWDIKTVPQHVSCGDASIITTTYGQLGTDSPQVTNDLVSEGKNVGKKNATTAIEQADLEAQAKWEKQKKKGYVDSIKAAEAGELDKLIEGGIVPMLAHKFAEQAHKIKYPAYVQPKLDGIRCIAILKDGTCTLWSRTRKPITSMPHIVAEIEKNFKDFKEDIILDGELYNQAFKSNFEHIVHLVRQEEPDKDHTDAQYHIYDMALNNLDFFHRNRWLYQHFPKNSVYLKLVDTSEVKTEDQILDKFESFRKQGYEGAMVRNSASMYVNKRSYDLLKVKEFDDGEFDIIGVEEGRGKLQGHAGAFLCRMPDGKTFLAKMSGDTDRLRDYFVDHNLWEGKKLTVQYQGLTGKEGVPRFPVGIAIRDYE